jgi:hypothetical protein
MMAQTPMYNEMTAASWQAAFILLNSWVQEGMLDKGSLALTASQFSVSKTAMGGFWHKINKKNCR